MKLFGVVIFTGNSTVKEDGGGGIHQPNSMTTDHDTEQVLKPFGKVICPLSTHNQHGHRDNHQDQRMIDNNVPDPSRREGDLGHHLLQQQLLPLWQSSLRKRGV